MVVFGQPIVEIALTTYRAIPPFLEKSFRFLLSNSLLDTKGIFRVCGSDVEIQRFQSVIDATGDITYPNDTKPFVVANLITRFIRQIPNHLLIDKNAAAWESVRTPEEAQKLFKALPLIHRAVFTRIIAFFRVVVQHKEKNCMEAKSLAIILSPILISKIDDRTWLLPFSTVEMLINRYDEIFGTMTSFDENGVFMSDVEFNSTIGDICAQFFCQSTAAPLKLKPLVETKQCKLTRNLEIPKTDWNALFGVLLSANCTENDTLSTKLTFI